MFIGRRVVKFVGGALTLPEADINEFLGGYDSNYAYGYVLLLHFTFQCTRKTFDIL